MQMKDIKNEKYGIDIQEKFGAELCLSMFNTLLQIT